MPNPEADHAPGISSGEFREACPSGIRYVGSAKLNQALVRNVRTCRSDAKEPLQKPSASDRDIIRGGVDWHA